MKTLILLAALLSVSVRAATDSEALRFDFGPGPVTEGFIHVPAAHEFSRDRGFGFEPGAVRVDVGRGGEDELRGDFVTSDAPFFFSVRVPEGNYSVTVTMGDRLGGTDTTVKAELRRLMLQSVTTTTGVFETRTFIVNVRRPQIASVRDIAAGEVRLKAPRETTQEAWAWDEALTLEFNGSRPAICALEIARVEVPTVFLLGDSTVCDQSREPYASWGQMFTRFFGPTVAIANHGESGETYRDSLGRRRLDKILSTMKPGDYLLMQFGHNDQKQIAAGTGGPFTTYKDEIKRHVVGVRAAGGVPVLLSPMERRGFDDEGRVIPSLADYAEAVRQVAEEMDVAFVDINAMSKRLYEALEANGPDYSKRAFAPNDNTHHNNYGAYQIAKCVVAGIRELELDLVDHLRPELPEYDPSEPDPVERFALPASPLVTHIRPLGDEAPGKTP